MLYLKSVYGIVKLFCLIQGSLGQNVSPLIALYRNMAGHPAKKQCLRVCTSNGTYVKYWKQLGY